MFITQIKDENTNFGTLSGFTYALKDVFVTKNILTTAGSKILNKFIPSYDCKVYVLLKEAGARLLGKTELDEFSCGSLGINNRYVSIINPYNNNTHIGGSSSGSSVAVASNICDFSLGTDTGGSVRLPALLCNIFGFKPSYGQISRYGVIPLCNELDLINGIGATKKNKILEEKEKTAFVSFEDLLNRTNIDIKKILKPILLKQLTNKLDVFRLII